MSILTAASGNVNDLGLTLTFDLIRTPGSYVCNWDGNLLRLQPDGLRSGGSPALNLVGSAPLTVTKLSHDPNLSLESAKALATELHVPVTF